MAPAEEIITDDSGLTGCCEAIASEHVFGFDTEFVGEDTYHPELCLIQVATPARLFLIDALAINDLSHFWALVTDPNRTVVVHAGRAEIRICHAQSGSPPGNLFDVQLAAGLVGLGYPLGHGPLLRDLLGIRLSKGETLTDWRKRPLSAAQIRYAFDDVRHLLPMWKRLNERLAELRRLSWADEEFETLKARSIQPNIEGERWRKLRGLGRLDRPRLALAREIFAWRDRRAEETNRPARTILRDDLIVEIAKRNPNTEQELSLLRGLNRAELPSLRQAIQQARQLPASAWPETDEREQDRPQIALVANLLNAVLADWCARNSLTPSLVASVRDLKSLVRGDSPGPGMSAGDNPLFQGWRRVAVLPELQAVLQGKRLIRVVDPTSATPLHVVDG